jgi:hypothetical protein
MGDDAAHLAPAHNLALRVGSARPQTNGQAVTMAIASALTPDNDVQPLEVVLG